MERVEENNSRNTEKTLSWSKRDIYQSLAGVHFRLTHKRKVVFVIQ